MPTPIRIALLLASLLIAPYAGAQSDAYQEASKLSRAGQQVPDDDYQVASKLFRTGRQTQALERVEIFLKSNPRHARARFLKGLILTEQNKPADAINIFTGLSEDYPELPEPYNNLAVLYASQGQYDKARTALEMAIRTHPSFATAHENLGDIYAQMASQAYSKALQLDKSSTSAQTKLETLLALAGYPQVELKTNLGTVTLELYPDKAPQTVENFLQYVRSGHYKGTIFHRVIPGFMIQGGGFNVDFVQKPVRAPIQNEAKNGLKNDAGTIAMARTPDPHSATAQFFINLKGNNLLNYPGQDGWGYTVFGKVVKGMDVVNKIAAVETGPGIPPHQNVPRKPVVIEDAKILPLTKTAAK